ncbi:globin family protein [Lyngbya confervoides]|uniref:Globin domain-containing protein n=1 Tax=Lyngbya confervoides BDU141951 TaxID=1574623 RepID=A0ABD4T1Y6_9CYAN|nr:globin family protein [Lyngbya confervoides]MCM1982604.1 globin domain-containing protein [Lyngbya confervoides BDU141951]
MTSDTSESAQKKALQVELLEQSFAKITPQASDFAASFYENLFQDYPEAKPLFATTNLQEQSKKLLSSLVFVVENLRQPEALVEVLQGLGARHVKYGALPEHYPLVGNTLLKTFRQYLQADWTPDIQQAWTDAYSVITEVMLEGADYSHQEIALESAPASEEAALKVKLLTESFALVAPQADAFAIQFYENLFTDYPAAKPLFASTDLPAQRKKLIASLVYVVENLKNPEALTSALKGLGARHVKYGALPEHYPLVGNTLLKTFAQMIGQNWTPEVRQAWVEAYGVITEVMLEGADYSQESVDLGPSTNGHVPPTTDPETASPDSVSLQGPNPIPIIAGLAGTMGILALLLVLL